MRRRNADSGAGRERLLSYWEPADNVGAPVGCVATTFTFDAAFFEEECLARFAGIEGDPREDARSYLIEREERLADLFACVFVDASQVAPSRSLRWCLLPVHLAGGGILHAKVSLLVWEDAIRVLVGSANLTEPAYRRNYEVAGALEFSKGSDLPGSLLAEVVSFFETLRALSPGGGSDAPPAGTGPHRQLADLLREARRRAETWPGRALRAGGPRAHFVPVGPGRPHLFEEAARLFPAQSGPLAARVVSPFFDEGDGSRRTVEALVASMGVHGERVLEFHARGRELPPPDRTLELDLPACLETPWLRRVTHRFSWVPECSPNSGELRPLHAKSLWLQREKRAIYILGSSNFTAAGTGVAGARANIEANLAYVLPGTRDRFAMDCLAATPPATAIDLTTRKVLFQQAPSRTAEASAALALPQAFGQALFEPGSESWLLLEIGAGVPRGFRVASAAGETLLTEAKWRAAGEPARCRRAWAEPRPPSHLVVHWTVSARRSPS